MSRSLRLSSSLNIDEEAKPMQKQGIVTILGADCDKARAASLRRTLSADMSSKKWLVQNGFSPLKKIASSEELSASLADSSSSSEGEEDYEERKGQQEGREEFDLWNSIQQEKKKQKELEKTEQFDIWSSILSQKANEDASKPLPPPYIHPLVKRSASSLSEKSLQICTESLGSETGSEGFSSYPPSETGDVDEDEEEEEEKQEEEEEAEVEEVQEQEEEDDDDEVEQQLQEDLKMCSQALDGEELRVAKYHYSSKKAQPRSFPPPLPSLSRQDGASVRMQSRRDNGRLVLEAVSIPSQNRFRAQRQDGRLVLTLADSPSNEEAKDEELAAEAQQHEEEEDKEKDKNEDFEEDLGDFEEVYEDDEAEELEEAEEEEEVEENEWIGEVDKENGTKEMEIVMEPEPELSSRVTNVHRLALMMSKPIGIAGRKRTWPRKFNEVVKLEEEVEMGVKTTPLTKSLPPRPRVARLIHSNPAVSSTAAAGSLNAYEYYWRATPTANAITQQPPAALKNNSSKFMISKNPAANEQQKLLVERGNKGDYLVPSSKGCKEPRRSLLVWEPYCIATS